MGVEWHYLDKCWQHSRTRLGHRESRAMMGQTSYRQIQVPNITGILKGNGTTVSAAVSAGTDYQAPITGAASTVLTSNLTADRVLASNSSGKISASPTNTNHARIFRRNLIYTNTDNSISLV